MARLVGLKGRSNLKNKNDIATALLDEQQQENSGFGPNDLKNAFDKLVSERPKPSLFQSLAKTGKHLLEPLKLINDVATATSVVWKMAFLIFFVLLYFFGLSIPKWLESEPTFSRGDVNIDGHLYAGMSSEPVEGVSVGVHGAGTFSEPSDGLGNFKLHLNDSMVGENRNFVLEENSPYVILAPPFGAFRVPNNDLNIKLRIYKRGDHEILSEQVPLIANELFKIVVAEIQARPKPPVTQNSSILADPKMPRKNIESDVVSGTDFKSHYTVQLKKFAQKLDLNEDQIRSAIISWANTSSPDDSHITRATKVFYRGDAGEAGRLLDLVTTSSVKQGASNKRRSAEINFLLGDFDKSRLFYESLKADLLLLESDDAELVDLTLSIGECVIAKVGDSLGETQHLQCLGNLSRQIEDLDNLLKTAQLTPNSRVRVLIQMSNSVQHRLYMKMKTSRVDSSLLERELSKGVQLLENAVAIEGLTPGFTSKAKWALTDLYTRLPEPKLQAALQLCEDVGNLSGLNSDERATALLNIGMLNERLGNKKVALAKYTEASEVPNTSNQVLAMILRARGGFRIESPEYAAAGVKDLNRVLTLEGCTLEWAYAIQSLIYYYGKQNFFYVEKIDSLYKKVLKEPKLPRQLRLELTTSYAKYLLDENRGQQVIDLLSSALAEDNIDHQSWLALKNYLAVARTDLPNPDKKTAIIEFDEIINDPLVGNELLAYALTNKGNALTAEGNERTSQAIELNSKAIELEFLPEQALATTLLNRSIAYFQSNPPNLGLAIADLERVTELKEISAELRWVAYQRLALYHSENLELHDEALDFIEKGLDINELAYLDRGALLNTKAEILYRTKQFESSVDAKLQIAEADLIPDEWKIKLLDGVFVAKDYALPDVNLNLITRSIDQTIKRIEAKNHGAAGILRFFKAEMLYSHPDGQKAAALAVYEKIVRDKSVPVNYRALSKASGSGIVIERILIEQELNPSTTKVLNKALDGFEESIKFEGISKRTKSDILLSRGGILLDLNQLSDAISDFSEVLALTDLKLNVNSKADALFQRSLAYNRMGRLDQEREDLYALVQLDKAPESLLQTARMHLGFIEIDRQNYESAIEFFDSVLKMEDVPDEFCFDAHTYRANALVALGEYYEAINELVDALDRFSDQDLRRSELLNNAAYIAYESNMKFPGFDHLLKSRESFQILLPLKGTSNEADRMLVISSHTLACLLAQDEQYDDALKVAKHFQQTEMLVNDDYLHFFSHFHQKSEIEKAIVWVDNCEALSNPTAIKSALRHRANNESAIEDLSEEAASIIKFWESLEAKRSSDN